MLHCQKCMMRVTPDGMCRCTLGNMPTVPILAPSVTAPQGWICPRCDRVNAPWMPCCLCKDGK